MLRSRGGHLYDVMVGLEFHVALLTHSKLLSGSSVSPSLSPNTCVSLYDAAHPGTLPRLNAGAVLQGLRAAQCLHAAVPRLSSFQRKHYFYADLPHGYQVTQLDAPLAAGGFLPFRMPLAAAAAAAGGKGGGSSSGATATHQHHPYGVARIARLQLEVDSGKSNHTLLPGASLVDLNRAGTALLEVVTEPDLRSAEEAVAMVAAMQAALVHAGVTGGAMELGQLRVDVNVSIRPTAGAGGAAAAAQDHASLLLALEGAYAYGSLPSMQGTADSATLPRGRGRGWAWRFHSPSAAAAAMAARIGGTPPSQPLDLTALPAALHPLAQGFGPRVEVKNLNSIKAVGRCVEGEAQRQAEIVEAGGRVQSETRAYTAAGPAPGAGAGAAAGSALASSSLLRGKEGGADYRFLPEPDLEPLLIPAAIFSQLQGSAARPLHAEYLRLTLGLGLRGEDAGHLVDTPLLLRAWRAVHEAAEAERGAQALARQSAGEAGRWQQWLSPGSGSGSGSGGAAAAQPAHLQQLARASCHWVLSEMLGHVREGESIGEFLARLGPLAPSALGRLVALVQGGEVSGKSGKALWSVLQQRLQSSGAQEVSPRAVAAELDLFLVTDPAAILALARQCVAGEDMAAARDKWRGGSDRVLGAFVARVLSESGGKACPELASEAVRQVLGPCGSGAGPGGEAKAHVGRKEAKRLAAAAAAAAAASSAAAAPK